MITVFTSTYNRGYIIESLYRSLCRQTIFDFEWLIVDDGSVDNTEDIVNSFIGEKKIEIRYFKQENSGKHVAINYGVAKAKGDLFFIVDSDDFLENNAIERLEYYYEQIKDNNSYAGVSGVCLTFKGDRIGGNLFYKVLDTSPLNLRMKYKVIGDMAEAFKTDVLKKYPFPVFQGERFCPEALIWNRLSLSFLVRYFNEGLCRCEYRSDGLTAKIVKIRMDSPHASQLYYSELYKMNIPFIQKIKAAINYWRFAFCSSDSFLVHLAQIGRITLFLYPIGFLFHIKDISK